MSGILTLVLEAMKGIVDVLKEAGLRDNMKVIIGVNLVTKEASEYVDAVEFATNATEGVKFS